MAITGTHMLFYTSEAERLRAMLRDVFGFNYVDAGDGWLIFELPPSEIGVHPDEGPTYESGTRHQISFMCDDLNRTIADLRAKGVTVEGDPEDQGYGIVTTLKLPGGCDVMLYQPRHAIAARIATRKKTVANTAPAKQRSAKKQTSSPRPGRRAKTAGRRR